MEDLSVGRRPCKVPMAILPSHSITSGKHQLCNHGRLIPDIHSWASLRATEGWAALQHHAVLRTTVTVYPPHSNSQPLPTVPNLLVELKGGSFFTLIPADVEWKQRHDFVPEWYSGNIYQVECAPPHLVNLPTVPSAVSPTAYYLYVSGDYEVLSPRSSPLGNTLLNCAVQIRLFGDPKEGGSETPILIISVNGYFESSSNVLNYETSYDMAPDFVEGFAFGDALGVGLRCLSTSWWTITAVFISNELRDTVSAVCSALEGPRVDSLCPNLGNCTFPSHTDAICSWPDTYSSYPTLTIQTILRGYALSHDRLRSSFMGFFCSNTCYPAWVLVGCCYYQVVLFFSRHNPHRIHRAPSDGLDCPSQGANLADTGLAFVHLLTRCCHVSRILYKDRWCGRGCFEAIFLGRVFTSSTTELDHCALGKDSVGMLPYSLLSSP
jgi:hypothetical protein